MKTNLSSHDDSDSVAKRHAVDQTAEELQAGTNFCAAEIPLLMIGCLLLAGFASTAPVPVWAQEFQDVPFEIALELKDAGNQIDITASLQPKTTDGRVGTPTELSIWVNDYQLVTWQNPEVSRLHAITLDKAQLRTGSNRVTGRTMLDSGSQIESESKSVREDIALTSQKLRGLTIGINEYGVSRKASTGSQIQVSDLRYAVGDAVAIQQILVSQKGVGDVHVECLSNESATKEDIFEKISKIDNQCSPDDWFIMSFSGHPCRWPLPASSGRSGCLMLLTSKSNMTSEEAALRTSIPISRHANQQDQISLLEKLAGMNCRKILLIDTNQSGEIIEELKANGLFGPTILTACTKTQYAPEVPTKAQGIFTAVLLEALTEKFSKADLSMDGWLSSRELFEYCQRRVPEVSEVSKRFFSSKSNLTGQNPNKVNS